MVAQAAPTTMRLQIDRAKIYLGESVIATVRVEGTSDETRRPDFPSAQAAKIDYLGSRNQSQTSVTIINGKMTRNVFEGRTFIYQITPSEAGTFRTGDLVLDSAGGRATCRGAVIEVVGVEPRDDIEASIACVDNAILVDSPFRITVSVRLRALPEPNAKVEPLWPQSPLHIQADFLGFPEVEGLKNPDADSSLGKFAGGQGRDPGFTINDYARQGGFGASFFDFGADPFARVPVLFRFPPVLEDRGGTNWWTYSFSLDYIPEAEGDYTFGPLTIKGRIVTGANPDRTPKLEEVFVVGPAITVRVVPPPEQGRPEWFSGGVGRSLFAKASLDTSKCKVGDPLSLTLEMTGDVSAGNLRPPVLNLQPGMPEDFRIYDDSVESETIEGGKRFRYRLRPLKPGTLEFPAILTAYYDTVKCEYVTVSSSPIPVQVEATTQIATGAAAADEEEQAFPDGVIWSADGGDAAFLPFALPGDWAQRKIGPWRAPFSAEFWLLPALCVLLGGIRLSLAAVRRQRERTRFGRLAAAELRKFRGAVRQAGRKPGGAIPVAISAVRAFVAASLSLPSRSMTAGEMRRAFRERGVDDAFAEELCAAFGTLEEIPYRKEQKPVADDASLLAGLERRMLALPDKLRAGKTTENGAGDWRSMASVLLFLLLSAATAAAGTFERQPDSFEWERAQSAMATARVAEDFSATAELYYAMVTNGAATGALFHNLGTALLLADKPRAAAEALEVAARWRGMSPEVLGNRLAAEAKLTGSAQLPPEKYLLIWHYGLPVQIRCAAAEFFWNLLWLLLAVAVLLPRQGKNGGALRAFRAFLNVALSIAGLGLLLFGASVAATYFQTRGAIDVSALEQVAAMPGPTDATGEAQP